MTDNKKTPIFPCHIEAGARMVNFAGWEMPIQYEGLIKEHVAVRERVGLFDVSHMGEVRVRGHQALEALQGLLTNDLSAISDGGAQYNVICNHTGGVVDDVVVYRFSVDDYMVCVNAANRQKDFDWLTKYNPCPDGANFTEESERWGQIAIQGRKAVATISALTDIPLSDLGVYHHIGATVAGIDGCIIARTGYTGEDGFEIFVPAAKAADLWRALLAAGEPHGVAQVGLGARDTLRLEARYCLYGHELNDETSPLAAGLGWVTKLRKESDFVGKSALIARKGNESHRLVGVKLEGKRIVREGMDVLVNGVVVGTVTSGTRSPTLQVGICLAYVQREFVKPGTNLDFDVRGRTASGTVVKGSFYKRDY